MAFYEQDQGTILPLRRQQRPDPRAMRVPEPHPGGAPTAPNQAPSPFTPQAAPPAPYVNPSARIAQQMAGLQQMGIPQGVQQGAVAQQASNYAQRRLAQLRRIAFQLPPELQAQLAQADGLDPAEAWRQISGSFANFARGQGVADPRQMLVNRQGHRGQEPY